MKSVAAFTLGVVACGACAGPSQRNPSRLPFHVALVPVRAETLSLSSRAAHESDGLQLAVDPIVLAAHLATTLERDCFERVTVLAPPVGTEAADFQSWSAERRDEYWVSAGLTAGADLLLESELRFERFLRGGLNEKFWLNLPLFLLGGPFCYFVGDRSYEGASRLDSWVYDLGALASGHASLGDGRAELIRVQARLGTTDLDFVDRAGGNLGLYALSILVPAGLLAGEGQGVERKVAAMAVRDLAAGVKQELRAGADEIRVARRVTSFSIDPGSRATGHLGELRFQGDVVLRRGEIERMDAWRLEADESVVEGEFSAACVDQQLSTMRDHYLRYSLDIVCPLPPDCTEAKLTLVSGGRIAQVRTFTYEVASNDATHSPSLRRRASE